MFRLPSLVLAALVSLSSVAGYAQDSTRGLRDVIDASEAPPPAPAPSERTFANAPPTPEQAMQGVELAKRAGQLMMITLEGTTNLTSTDRQVIRDFSPGGIILHQVTDPATAALYVQGIRQNDASVPLRLPMLIGTDLLTVSQFRERPGGFYLDVPSMLTLGAAGATQATQRLFNIIAEDLSTMGFLFHVGPPLSLASALPGDTQEQVHTFGASQTTAAALVEQFGTAMDAANVLWMPVGFPGGGSNGGPGEPSVLLTPRSELRAHDLLPYERAIAAGAKIIHVGTTLVPTIDEARPACLSPIVMKDLLRDTLGFDGLIVAGPMDSSVIRSRYDPSEAAIEALMAGADMILWDSSGQRIINSVATLVSGVGKGALDESLIDDAYARVIAFKQEHNLKDRPLPDVGDARALNDSRRKSDHAVDIHLQSITVVKNYAEMLPLTFNKAQPIGITGIYGVEELTEALEEYIDPIQQQRIRTAAHLTRIPQFEIERLIRRSDKMRTVIVILPDNIELQGQLQLLREFRTRGKQIVVILGGYPKNLAAFVDADAIILAYDSVNYLGRAMKAVADILVGDGPLQILPPLRDIELRAGEQFVFDANEVVRSPIGRMPITISPPFVAGHSISYRPDLDRVRWAFGDGKSSRNVVATHAYKKPGRYTVTLEARTTRKNEAEGSFHVVVHP